jgi:inosine-uridine nucleoside N-ribohydrolase
VLPEPRSEPVAQHAVDFLADAIRARGGALTLVPTGPLTNVALLLTLHPDARPERIVLMGGAVGEGNVTPAAEFNVWADPEAASRVFQSGIPVTMIGLDVTHKALITRDHTERLRGSGRVGRMAAELLDFYQRFHGRHYPEFGGGSPMHDPVAVAQVFRPEIVETRPAYVEVDCGWEQGRGRTNAHLRGRSEHEPNAEVGVDVDAEAFAELLLERVGSLG